MDPHSPPSKYLGQPTGRIHTFCPKHRIFPRSYPFHTLFDLLSITLSLLYSIFYLEISPRLAIDLLVYYRYKDCDEDNGLKALRKWRWLRWAMFALGGAQPAIKLAAFKGLPVTKAVGMTWTVSWVVLEILGLLARDVDFWPDGEGPPTLRQNTAWVAAKKMNAGNQFLYSWMLMNSLATVSEVMSWILCLFIMQDVLFDGRRRLSLDLVLIETGGLIIGGGGSIFVNMSGSQFRISSFTSLGLVGTTFMLMTGGLVMGAGFKILLSRTQRPDVVLYLGHSALFIFGTAVEMACGRPLVRRKFAFDKANCSEGCVNRGLPGIFGLLINIMFVILWYAYRYRSEGTYNPGWTSVFG